MAAGEHVLGGAAVWAGELPMIDPTKPDRRKAIDFDACPRYDKHELSDEQIAQIAEAAAVRAVQIARDKFYQDVGKSVVSKWFIFIGLATVAGYAWLRSKNIL